jgi:peptide/nickel transport system permease protein
VLIVLLLTFAGARLSGSPLDMLSGDGMSAADRAALEAEFGLDQPLPVQFVGYVSSLAHGNLGSSIAQRRPVLAVYTEALPTTLRLALASLLTSLALGLPLGVLAALRENQASGRIASAIVFFGYAVPHFLLGVILVLIFGLALGWLPTIGQDDWRNYVLPALALSAGLAATIARFLRAGLIEAMAQDYIRTARAGGVPWHRVVFRLALRNALLPVLTILGLHLGGLFAGSLIIENLFAMRGIGQAFIGAVQNHDYPVLQFGVIALALAVVAVNMVVDVLYALFDPRIRTGATA